VGQGSHGGTVTISPGKPTSSRAPADRKALACSRLLDSKDLLRTSAVPRAPGTTKAIVIAWKWRSRSLETVRVITMIVITDSKAIVNGGTAGRGASLTVCDPGSLVLCPNRRGSRCRQRDCPCATLHRTCITPPAAPAWGCILPEASMKATCASGGAILPTDTRKKWPRRKPVDVEPLETMMTVHVTWPNRTRGARRHRRVLTRTCCDRKGNGRRT
jgi:hypothetical protein